MDFDKVLEDIGSFGKFQQIQLVLGAISSCVSCLAIPSLPLMTLTPEFWCNDGNVSSSSSSSSSNISNTSLVDDACYNDYVDMVDDYPGRNESATRVPCQSWLYDIPENEPTIVTQWDLVCRDAYKRSLATSMYMVGFLFGSSLFGWISDRYGRKTSWTIAYATSMISGLVDVFMPDYWSFVAVRFVQGTGNIGVYTIMWVMLLEITGVEMRTKVGLVQMVMSSVGYIMLAGVAYFVRSYVWLQVVVTLAGLFNLPACWLLCESPRWLLARGQKDRAIQIIAKIAKMNGTSEQLVIDNIAETDFKDEKVYTCLDLIRSWPSLLATLDILLSWMVVTLVFYGLLFSSVNFSGNPYLNLSIASAVEIPGYLAYPVVLDRLGRRAGLAGSMLGSGVACLAIILVPANMGWVKTVLFLIGKVCITAGFGVIYTYTCEFYPTVTRSIALGAGSTSARVGGLLAPFVTDFGNLIWQPLPQVVFGGMTLLAGLAALLLPETRHRRLPDTLEEGDALARRMMLPEACVKRNQDHSI